MLAMQPSTRGYLRLSIIVQEADSVVPLVSEQADCRDVFDVLRELEEITGPRLRRALHDAAVRGLKPPEAPSEGGAGVTVKAR